MSDFFSLLFSGYLVGGLFLRGSVFLLLVGSGFCGFCVDIFVVKGFERE